MWKKQSLIERSQIWVAYAISKMLDLLCMWAEN